MLIGHQNWLTTSHSMILQIIAPSFKSTKKGWANLSSKTKWLSLCPASVCLSFWFSHLYSQTVAISHRKYFIWNAAHLGLCYEKLELSLSIWPMIDSQDRNPQYWRYHEVVRVNDQRATETKWCKSNIKMNIENFDGQRCCHEMGL